MSIYFKDIPLPQAQLRFHQALAEDNLWRVLANEIIALDEHALGRVLAEPVWAKTSSPHYHAAAMDGFAVMAHETLGAQPTNPVDLPLRSLGISDTPRRAEYVDTGDPLPDWANAVIPVEEVEALDEFGKASLDLRRPARIRIRAGVAPWTHVRPLGEDIVATQLVLTAGHVLRPVDLGAIAAAGHNMVKVARKPRVAIVPSGTELVPIGSKLGPGSIMEYNSLVLATQIISMGGEATRFPIVADNPDEISRAVLQAARHHDLVLLNAGSSAGSEDFSVQVIAKLGRVLVHGVAVRPGHPVILGMIEPSRQAGNEGSGYGAELTEQQSLKAGDTLGSRPIIGVPGYPVSAALTVAIFVEPLLAKWLGRPTLKPNTTAAELTRKVTSPAGDEDHIRVVVGRVGSKFLAAPLSRGAGVITSLVQADGVVVIPPGVQGIEAGEDVEVQLYRSAAVIESTIFCIGSHDLILDLIAQSMIEFDRRFVSSNVGSQGGLVALRRRKAHLAGSHLLDPETGQYNLSYIRQYMPGIPVRVVMLAGREQGLVVRRSNPLRVTKLQDLMRRDVVFMNRQRGAGTRVLLDYHLGLLGISPDSIRGYDQEEYTHLGVAAAVASGRAHCGLAIAAAAQALDLGFVPLFKERYDLVVPKEHADSELLAPLFKILRQAEFQRMVSSLPGYDTTSMGAVVLED